MKALLAVLLLIPALSQAQSKWKTEADFRKAAPAIHRKALWLEENPTAATWGDSLKIVLSWGHEVPYATLGTAKVFEKELQNLPKDPAAGRVASMMQVGFIQLATEDGFSKASEFDMAKAGLVCMIHYYQNVQRDKDGFSIPAMEKYAGLLQNESLDDYIKAKLRK